ncbi:MAG: hypothetical protein PWP65_1831 [Clostridia bacterium]|nr:hypothetical protein [Clostridia bacterium]
MNCQEAQDLFSPYLDGELKPRQKRELEDHINRCRQCVEDLTSLHLAVAAIRSLQETELFPPPQLKARVCGRIKAITRYRRLSLYLTWAAGAVAVLLLTVALNITFSQESQVQSRPGVQEHTPLQAVPPHEEVMAPQAPQVMKQGSKVAGDLGAVQKSEAPPRSQDAKAVQEKRGAPKGQPGEQRLQSGVLPVGVPARKSSQPTLIFALSLFFLVLAFLSWFWWRRIRGFGP